MSVIEEKSHPEIEWVAPTKRSAEALRPERPDLEPVQQRKAPAEPAPRPRRRRPLVIGLVALLVIGVIIGGVIWWLNARNWVSTDDAFIDTHVVQISPQVAGRVAKVLVNDNQEVRAGQPIVEIDPANFQAAQAQALANEQSSAGQLAQAKAQIPVAAANLAEAKAGIGVAEAAANNAEINLRRDRILERMGSLALSRQKLDNDLATARSDAANLAAAKQKAAGAEAQLKLAQTQVETAEAGVRAAEAQLRQAKLNLSYTEIRASEAGRITKKSVAVGDYIQVGQNLMALVPDEVWVTANFKETDLADMHVGQPVEIHVDAYPDHVFHGRVQSIQAGSGAAFSLLPPENATGNYVKVVQRVPVKIVFDQDPGEHYLLGPGMSVVPDVKIR